MQHRNLRPTNTHATAVLHCQPPKGYSIPVNLPVTRTGDKVTLGKSTIQPVRCQGHRPESNIRGVEYRVADRRRDTDDRGLSRACRRDVLPVDQHHFDPGEVAEARDPVVGETGIGHHAVFKFDGLE